MLHAGLDLSRRKIDVCLLSAGGEVVEEFTSPPDGDGLGGLARRVGRHERPVRAVNESMTGSRFVHDRLEELGWDVLIADAAKAKGLAPLACKIDARVQSFPKIHRGAARPRKRWGPTHAERPAIRGEPQVRTSSAMPC